MIIDTIVAIINKVEKIIDSKAKIPQNIINKILTT
jgi:hypothetical protein